VWFTGKNEVDREPMGEYHRLPLGVDGKTTGYDCESAASQWLAGFSEWVCCRRSRRRFGPAEPYFLSQETRHPGARDMLFP
jgi:hypothetical protein